MLHTIGYEPVGDICIGTTHFIKKGTPCELKGFFRGYSRNFGRWDDYVELEFIKTLNPYKKEKFQIDWDVFKIFFMKTTKCVFLGDENNKNNKGE